MKLVHSSVKPSINLKLGGFVVLVLVLLGLFSPWIVPHDPYALSDSLLLPVGSEGHWLGTDDLGRDVLSRLIAGTRLSLGTGFLVVVFAGLVGGSLGLLSGFFGGKFDLFVSWLTDMVMALPSMLLGVVVVALLGPSLENAILAVGIVALPNFIRVMRSSAIVEKQKLYVQASVSFGSNSFFRLVRHVIPNSLAPFLVQCALGFSDGILNVAALGFLGLGAPAPLSEWGVMLSDSRAFLESHPVLVTMPGLMILISVIAFNLMGDGLRDRLDPKLKQ